MYPFSYIEKTWDDAYLCFRGPSPVNVSPAFLLKKTFPECTQARAAAKLTASIVNYIKQLQLQGLECDGSVDVSQLEHQFCFSRVPGPQRDSLHQANLSTGSEVTVLCEGYLFLVKVIDQDGNPFNEEKISECFEHVISTVPKEPNPAPISVLTAGPRNDWATSHEELLKDESNQEVLRRIRESIIVICLDSEEWGTNLSVAQEAMLHGGKMRENRWYDKHQLIVSKDGRVAGNFEHAFSDGLTWCSWLGECIASLNRGNEPKTSSQNVACGDLVQPVTITFGKTFAARIREAKRELGALTSNVQLRTVEISIGKKQLKMLNFSPDAFAQLCFHCAFFCTRGKIAPTYESCSTAKFFHGRTETVRTATAAVQTVIQCLSKSEHSDLDALIRIAQEKHRKLCKEAADGHGIDRHLLALKKLAEAQNDTAALQFFNDELFVYSSTWLMSTSNVSQPFLELFNFGPVTQHGYGIGYMVEDECIRCGISTFNDCTDTNAEELGNAIVEASKMLLKKLKSH
jgi:hypothetical protein